METIKAAYYYLDLLVGFGSPILLYFLVRFGRVKPRDWRLFWLGALIGLTWEIPIFLMSKLSAMPVIFWIREPPVHYVFLMICHTLWDGAIFVVGVWLAVLLCKNRTVLSRFSWAELSVMVLWGQISAFLVEFSSISSEAWEYFQGYWWNPTVLVINGRPITLIIQIAWFFAPIAFYLIALKMQRPDDQS